MCKWRIKMAQSPKTVPWCNSTDTDPVSRIYSSKASKSAFLRSLNMADTYIEPWQLHSRFQSCDGFWSARRIERMWQLA